MLLQTIYCKIEMNTTLGETAGLLKVNKGGTHSNHCFRGRTPWLPISFITLGLHGCDAFCYTSNTVTVTAQELKIHTNCTYTLSSYRAVNTLRLCYKTSRLMLYREIIAVCSEIHKKHINTLVGQNEEFVNLNLAIYIVTTVRYIW